jgi:hypothetical protein
MKIPNNILLFTISACLILLLGCDKKNANDVASSGIITDTQKKEIEEVFSELITRNADDRTYSGQIKSEAGLAEFENLYEVKLQNITVDFKDQMLIFGITDNISTRAVQFLKHEHIQSFVLEYTDIGIQYKLKAPDKGKKHSYLQVFVLKKIDGVSHIKVKNLIRNGLSKVYGK